MNDLNAPAEALFHESLAWNLFEDALEAQFVGPPDGASIWGQTRARGIAEGWLSPSLRQQAREMFVFCDKIVMPVKGTTPLLTREGYVPATFDAGSRIPQLRGALRWVSTDPGDPAHDLRWERAWSLTASSQSDLVRELWPFILSAPKVRLNGFDESHLEPLLRLYSDPRLWPSASEKIRLLHNLVDAEFGFLVESLMLAEQQIPAIGMGPRLAPFSNPSSTPGVECAVGMYFKDVVRCPSPRNLQEAIELRGHERIGAWRKKVLEWSGRVASGKADWSVVKDEIDEANGYIEGAEWTSRIVPAWSVFITLPLDAINYVATGVLPFPWITLGVSTLQAYGLLAKTGADRSSRYPWLISRA
jgi:hypothetical protein